MSHEDKIKMSKGCIWKIPDEPYERRQSPLHFSLRLFGIHF